ncbi:MAG: DUF4215 domain-containing protein [Polyangiaceae bacterium]
MRRGRGFLVVFAGVIALQCAAVACGGSNSPIVVHAPEDAGASDASSPEAGADAAAPDAKHEGAPDASSDQGAPEASTGDATADQSPGDAAADQTTADAPGDQSATDAGADQTAIDATPDQSTADSGGDATAEAGSAACGNSIRESGEQCDDGNTVSFDGCSAACQFEQDTRATKVLMEWGTDSSCGANATGGAFGTSSTVRNAVQSMIDTNVQAGGISVLLTYLGIQNLSGASGAASVGSVTGTPEYPDASTYNGTADLDWWYAVDPTALSGGQIASKLLPGTFTGATLTAGPGTVWVSFSAGQTLEMVNTTLHLPVGASSVPVETAGTTPPGHVPGEHLDPAVSSFATGGGTNTAATGYVCGAITAASLATSVIPSALLPGGADQCNQGYTTANSMLDVFVGGCSASVFNVTVIKSTQPDTNDPDAPAAGAGGAYTLSASASTRMVNGCKDKSGATVSLSACLAAAAYSSYLHLAVDRVVLR